MMISTFSVNNTSIREDILNGDSLDTVGDLTPGEEREYQGGTNIGDWTVNESVVTVLEKTSIKINQHSSPLKHSAVLFNDGIISHKISSLAPVRYTLSLEHILSTFHTEFASYILTVCGYTEGSRENIFKQEYTATTGDISEDWKQNRITFTPRCRFTDCLLIIDGKNGCIISDVSLYREAVPEWNIRQISPQSLVMKYHSTGKEWRQEDDWRFLVTDRSTGMVPPKGTQVHFCFNKLDFGPYQTDDGGYVTLPFGRAHSKENVTLDITVGDDIEKHSFPVTLLQDDKKERLIFSPEPGDGMVAPVDGLFNEGKGISVGIEEYVNGDWQPKRNGNIKADLLNPHKGAPYFNDQGDQHHFAGKMDGTKSVALPVIHAGTTLGIYTLKISDADSPEVKKTIELTVQSISSFDHVEPVGGHDSVSRNWTTEDGRWYVKALLADDKPAPDQPVEYRLDDPHGTGVTFVETKDIKQNGKTDRQGYARIPAIVVPDEDSSFSVYVEAGDGTVPENHAQAGMMVSIITILPVNTITPIEWVENMSTLKGQTFSVRLEDVNGNLVTSGRNVIFKIEANNAGATFMDNVNSDTDTDIVPARLGHDGRALVTCREITCSHTGDFTLSVSVQGDTAPFAPKIIEVTA